MHLEASLKHFLSPLRNVRLMLNFSGHSIGSALVFLVTILATLSANAQGPTSNWYFGNNAGVSFTSGSPVAFGNSSLASMEGVSSISNAAGSVLFYTNGMTVWDRNDNPMPNGTGLFGGSSSSQSAVVIRKPLSNNLFYIFTADQDLQPDGICYSLVNMSLNSGLGDVVAATKNVSLLNPATEKLTAVAHCNEEMFGLSHTMSQIISTMFGW